MVGDGKSGVRIADSPRNDFRGESVMWVNENELERCVCTAILWKDEVVLDMMEYHNEAQLAPFLRTAMERGATKFESTTDGHVTVVITGRDIIVKCTKCEMILAYHMVKRGLSEQETLRWLDESITPERMSGNVNL